MSKRTGAVAIGTVITIGFTVLAGFGTFVVNSIKADIQRVEANTNTNTNEVQIIKIEATKTAVQLQALNEKMDMMLKIMDDNGIRQRSIKLK